MRAATSNPILPYVSNQLVDCNVLLLQKSYPACNELELSLKVGAWCNGVRIIGLLCTSSTYLFSRALNARQGKLIFFSVCSVCQNQTFKRLNYILLTKQRLGSHKTASLAQFTGLIWQELFALSWKVDRILTSLQSKIRL